MPNHIVKLVQVEPDADGNDQVVRTYVCPPCVGYAVCPVREGSPATKRLDGRDPLPPGIHLELFCLDKDGNKYSEYFSLPEDGNRAFVQIEGSRHTSDSYRWPLRD